MLIPFGVFSAAGAGATNSYELIATSFGTGSSNSVTFSSIPSTYKHLQLRIAGRTLYSGNSPMIVRLNGDTTNGNYAWHFLYGNGSSVTSAASTSTDGLYARDIPGPPTSSSIHSATIYDFLDYTSTTKNKTSRTLHGDANSSNQWIVLTSGVWMNTAAINQITILNYGNFATTARFSLYGIKG